MVSWYLYYSRLFDKYQQITQKIYECFVKNN